MARRFQRPPQGWTALGWGLGVVFLGIVLALGAQQLVDAWYWRGQAHQAKQAVEQELLEHEKNGYERLAVQPCLRGQLAELSTRLISTEGQWTAMPMIVQTKGVSQAVSNVVPTAYRAPRRRWLDEAFNTAQATGALNHLPDALTVGYARAYQVSRRAIILQDREDEAAAQLSMLAIDGNISAESRLQLLAALSKVDSANGDLENNIRQELGPLGKLLKDVPIAIRQAGVKERIDTQRKFRGSCVLPLALQS